MAAAVQLHGETRCTAPSPHPAALACIGERSLRARLIELLRAQFGPPNPRDTHPTLADFAFDGAPNGDASFGLSATAVPQKIGQQVTRKNHVLVCAPSNRLGTPSLPRALRRPCKLLRSACG